MWCRSVLDQTNFYPLKYDKLVIAVGAVSNTFGIPGVQEHAFFLKVRIAIGSTSMIARPTPKDSVRCLACLLRLRCVH